MAVVTVNLWQPAPQDGAPGGTTVADIEPPPTDNEDGDRIADLIEGAEKPQAIPASALGTRWKVERHSVA